MSRRRIDSGLIWHLVWTPDQELPQNLTPQTSPQKQPIIPNQYGVDDFVGGKSFYEHKIPDSLEKALEFAGAEGIVLTCPELIAAKVKADKSHEYWQNWMSVYTEENIGLDRGGNAQLVTIHGGGILTLQRIRRAYGEELINGSAKYEAQEFYDILEGRVPSGDTIPMFSYEQIKEGVDNLPHRFGIITPYDLVKDLESDWYKREGFVNNPLTISRIANLKLIEPFYEKAKDSDNDVGCYHPFKGRNPSQAQGRLLFVNLDFGGLIGHYVLGNYGRFVGVVPKAHGSPTRSS